MRIETRAASVTALRGTVDNLKSLGLATCVLLAGCGGGEGGEGGRSAPKNLPACAKKEKAIKRPAQLPADLPVPPGTRFVQLSTQFGTQVIATGYVPGTLDDVRAFYAERLEDAGYQQGRNESEAGLEVEALFTGKGVRGGWRANVLRDCEGASALTLVVIRT
jgi:DNA-binding CsgD family transcriptional regulator